MKKLLCSLLTLAASASADFEAQRWRLRAPVSVTSGMAISDIPVSEDIFRHSTSQLKDVRVVRGEGEEVPFVIHLMAGSITQEERGVRILNKSWTKSRGVQAVLDLVGHAEHNRLRIGTQEHNFKQSVMVETSDDGKHWAMVLSNGVIFDIARPETIVSDLTVNYPTSTRRYVRVTVPGWKDAASLESAWLAEQEETDSVRDDIGKLEPAVTEHKDEQTTDVVYDLGFRGQPCDRLDLEVAPGYFVRSMEVSSGNDLKQWLTRRGAAIDRTGKEEHLRVEWPESWDRYIKLTIFNADSAPLHFGKATASAIRRTIRFPSSASGKYWLYISNDAAHSASYDFARLDYPAASAAVAKVGAFEANPDYKDQELRVPYSERNPWLLNVALGFAVAVMAFITYRFARKATLPKA